MRVRVLGAAAGGAFPQWNCACANCELARAGSPRVTARTEDSLAISSDGESWFVLNASPSIHAQIAACPSLWPKAGRRSPIAGIVLTNGDVDHCLGLFQLRESTPLVLYATEAVFRGLGRNVLLRTLQRFDGQLTYKCLRIGEETPLAMSTGEPSGLSIVPHAAVGKLPIHIDGLVPATAEDNVALWVHEQGNARKLAYATAAATLDGIGAPLDALTAESCVFFDGTFWRDDELIELGLGKARARDMAHLPIGGAHGSLAQLSRVRARRIFTHINNTNPILDRQSAERDEVERAGWSVAYDGMELTL